MQLSANRTLSLLLLLLLSTALYHVTEASADQAVPYDQPTFSSCCAAPVEVGLAACAEGACRIGICTASGADLLDCLVGKGVCDATTGGDMTAGADMTTGAHMTACADRKVGGGRTAGADRATGVEMTTDTAEAADAPTGAGKGVPTDASEIMDEADAARADKWNGTCNSEAKQNGICGGKPAGSAAEEAEQDRPGAIAGELRVEEVTVHGAAVEDGDRPPAGATGMTARYWQDSSEGAANEQWEEEDSSNGDGMPDDGGD